MALSAVQLRLVGDDGPQVVEIVVANGYHPSVVEARAGVPLRLVFHRLDAHECSDRVVFSEPRLIRHLAPGADTVVDLPAAGPGEVRFTCGMGRYRGRIERRDQPGRGGAARATSLTPRQPTPDAAGGSPMITHAEHAEHAAGSRSGARPRWLMPALAIAASAAVLLYLGVVTPSSLLSIGLFGGMIGMHLFGHGSHGGHGGHEAHARDTTSTTTSADAVGDHATAHRGCH